MQLTKTTFFLGCLVGGLGAALAPLLFTSLHAEPRLLPFQGRLTDPAGMPIADGAKVVQFQLYDAPTGGNVKWVGEVQKLTINGGLVNTLLGSKASLSNVDFSTATYLQITVDANGDNQITLADPPLLPRQSVVPAIYASEAGNSRKLAGADWSVLMVNSEGIPTNDPVGFIPGSRLQASSVGSRELIPAAVTTVQIAPSAVTTGQIMDGTIQVADLSSGLQNSITPPGMISAYASPLIPFGWEICDGRAVSRTDPKYAALFTVIGITHGTGDGASTFNLPDYRGRFLRGTDGAAGRDPDSVTRLPMSTGGAAGNAVGSVQLDQFESHIHTGNMKNGAEPLGAGARADTAAGSHGSVSPTWISQGLVNATGGAETRPANAYVNYLIKL